MLEINAQSVVHLSKSNETEVSAIIFLTLAYSMCEDKQSCGECSGQKAQHPEP